MITQTLKLNLIPGQVLPRVNVSQYDAGTRTLQMLLYNGDQAFNISAGLGGFVQGTKPDRTGFQYAATVTEGSNVVTLVITQQMTAVSGEVTCELVIANGDDRIATVNFILYVEPAALADDTVISETELPLIEEAAELAQRIDGITADVEADADRAEAAVEHYPYIGANGNWYVFDLQTEQFVDTTIAATGPQGPQGNDGPTGPQGPTGPTGNGIVSITKTGTSGLVDTYTILFTDGTTTTFTVTNGQDGQGSGDMTKAVYDSTNAVADAGGIVAYVAAHSGAGTLAGLDDVTLSSLAAGDTLIYNATTQKWENSTVIQTLTNQVKDMNNILGAKNILPFDLTDIKALNTDGTWASNVYSYRGVDFTVNSDGTISATGTATGGNASIKLFVSSSNYEMLGKEVILNGCPSGGGASTYRIQAYRMTTVDGSSESRFDDGTGTAFTVLNNASGTVGSFSVVIYENAIVTNLLFKPMVRLASITDDTYEPYAKTNQQLTQDTTGLLDNTEVNGAVNMLPNNATSQVVNGVTFTVNDDGTVTANGTSTAFTSLVIAQHGQASFFDDFIGKPIKLSGCPSGGASNTYKLRFDYASGNYVDDVGEGVIITPTAGNSNTWYVEIGISGGVTLSNLTFKPMITVPSYNGPYVPYAKSNKELTEELTIEYGNITTTVTMTEWNLHNVKKYGHVVEAQLTCNLGEAVSAWGTLATIPIGFRPPSGNYPQVVGMKGNYTSFVNLQIAPDGSIQPAISLNSGETIRMNITYIV